MIEYGPASCGVDLKSDGMRTGFIDVLHSDNRHDFSAIQVPIAVIGNGAGPTMIMSAGNHGDEYEGQVIVHQLMSQLSPDMIAGRLIVLPALNAPAVLARARVSPIDGGNMNRIYPGSKSGGPTAAIAGFVNAHLIPLADVIMDFHSGGTATNYASCGFICLGEDKKLNAQNVALAERFGAPFTCTVVVDRSGGSFDVAAKNQEKPFLSCELGGMGTVTPRSRMIGWKGSLRVLEHVGILTRQAFQGFGGTDNPEKTIYIDFAAKNIFSRADRHGLADIRVKPGDKVNAGEEVAIVYDLRKPGYIIETLKSHHDGFVVAIRRNPLVDPGDNLVKMAPEFEADGRTVADFLD